MSWHLSKDMTKGKDIPVNTYYMLGSVLSYCANYVPSIPVVKVVMGNIETNKNLCLDGVHILVRAGKPNQTMNNQINCMFMYIDICIHSHIHPCAYLLEGVVTLQRKITSGGDITSVGWHLHICSLQGLSPHICERKGLPQEPSITGILWDYDTLCLPMHWLTPKCF